jgi:hypothetical protein
MITREDVQKLKAPLPLEEGHEVREATVGEDWAQWLVYTEEDPVKERLDDVDPNWTWVITDKHYGDKFVTIYGTLTVLGVSRDCVGDGTTKKSEPSGDAEKGAATDALKRGARLFGVGLYLKNAPRITTDWVIIEKSDNAEEKKRKRNIQSAARKEAFAKFEKWYRQQFGAASKPIPARQPDPARIIGRDELPAPQPETAVSVEDRPFTGVTLPEMIDYTIEHSPDIEAGDKFHGGGRLWKAVTGTDGKPTWTAALFGELALSIGQVKNLVDAYIANKQQQQPALMDDFPGVDVVGGPCKGCGDTTQREDFIGDWFCEDCAIEAAEQAHSAS